MRASRLRIRSLASAPSLGNRTTETIDGTTRYYTYDNNDKLTAISGGGQSASLSYDNNRNPFDRLTASMTGVSGTVTDTYELDTFGRSVSSSGTTPSPYRGVYPERSRRGAAWGYLTDATLRTACPEAASSYQSEASLRSTSPSRMLQLGARFYWREVGRFVSQDPIGEEMNPYSYAHSNPLVYADPSGELSFGDIGRAARRGAGAVGRAARAVGRAAGAVGRAAGAAFDAANPYGGAKGFAKACPTMAGIGQTTYCKNIGRQMDDRIDAVGSPGAAQSDPEYQRLLQLYNQRCRAAGADKGLLPVSQQ